MCFLILQKWRLLFLWTFYRKILQTLLDYNFAWGLPNHTPFDDLYLVSGSQGHRCFRIMKCKVLFRFLSNVKCCMFATYIKTIKLSNSMLCVTDV